MSAPLDVEPPGAAPPSGTVWVRVLTTAYCPCARCCGMWADGITARMRDTREHPRGIAADFSLVPPGTELDVPHYGVAVVDDTGSAMRASGQAGVVHLDVRFSTHEEALSWGRQWHWIAIPEATPAASLTELPA